ncbi:hypothetical protein NIES2101_42490 [Calothrix sp. HK-06]|nr:hypothetical protein NIES2101_42490 [Calothrix sp. HK-06]
MDKARKLTRAYLQQKFTTFPKKAGISAATQLADTQQYPTTIEEVEETSLVLISIKIPSEWMQEIEAMSQTSGLTASLIIFEAIQQYLIIHSE